MEKKKMFCLWRHDCLKHQHLSFGRDRRQCAEIAGVTTDTDSSQSTVNIHYQWPNKSWANQNTAQMGSNIALVLFFFCSYQGDGQQKHIPVCPNIHLNRCKHTNRYTQVYIICTHTHTHKIHITLMWGMHLRPQASFFTQVSDGEKKPKYFTQSVEKEKKGGIKTE